MSAALTYAAIGLLGAMMAAHGLFSAGLNTDQVAFVMAVGGVTLVSGVAGAVGMFRGMKNGEEG